MWIGSDDSSQAFEGFKRSPGAQNVMENGGDIVQLEHPCAPVLHYDPRACATSDVVADDELLQLFSGDAAAALAHDRGSLAALISHRRAWAQVRLWNWGSFERGLGYAVFIETGMELVEDAGERLQEVLEFLRRLPSTQQPTWITLSYGDGNPEYLAEVLKMRRLITLPCRSVLRTYPYQLLGGDVVMAHMHIDAGLKFYMVRYDLLQKLLCNMRSGWLATEMVFLRLHYQEVREEK